MIPPELEAKLAELDAQNPPGWFTPAEGRACVERILDLETPYPVLVEIGSYCGRSTRYLALAARVGGRVGTVHAIDHFQGSEEHQPLTLPLRALFEASLEEAGVAGPVYATGWSSKQAWENRLNPGLPIHFLLVDGSHDTDSVHFDLAHWGTLVPEGGIVALHDYTWGTVRRAMENFFDEFHWLPLSPVDDLAFFRRIAG